MNFENFKTRTCMFCQENLVRNLRYIKCADKLADHQLEIDMLNKHVFITCIYNKYVIKLDFMDDITTFARGQEKIVRNYIIDFANIDDIETFAINNFAKLDMFK